MKGLVKKERAPGLWMEDVPMPEIKDHEVLIKTRKTSICGTDVHIYKWDAWAQRRVPVPMVIGHEFMGEVVKVGKQVKHLKGGERVCGEGHLVCNQCPSCRMEKNISACIPKAWDMIARAVLQNISLFRLKTCLYCQKPFLMIKAQSSTHVAMPYTLH